MRYSEKLFESVGISVHTLDLSDVFGWVRGLDDGDAGVTAEIERIINKSQHTRLPVYSDNIDQIVGILHLRRLANLAQRSFVVDGVFSELDDRTRLDIAPGANVVADAGGRRAKRLAFVVPVGVDFVRVEGHVGLEQCNTDFAQGCLDAVFSQAALAAQLGYRARQALGQIFKHELLRKQKFVDLFGYSGYYSPRTNR